MLSQTLLEKEDAAGTAGAGARRAADGKPSVWLRIVLPAVLIVVWLAGAGIGGPYFGKVGEVASNDQAAFLPASADATLVGERFTDFVGDEQIPAVVVFASGEQLTQTQLDGVVGRR